MKLLATLAVLAASLTVVPASAAPLGAETVSAAPQHCARMGKIDVPKAPMQKKACLDDLSTESTSMTGHTDASDWAALHAPGTRNPSGFPGIQVDGYFPDSSTTNARNGWNHDSQFVIRLPDDWNGRLVVAGAPGVRSQYANDFIFSDWLLARGYAYAATDKGNTGTSFYNDGKEPGDAIAEWNRRVTQLGRAAKAVVEQRYGKRPQRSYVFGISNGGYLVRWQLENRARMWDGGVDWEGTLYTPREPNLLTYLPAALKHYPSYAATGDQSAHDAMIKAGFQRGSEFTWDYHYGVYWDLTQRVYREELDPSYDGDVRAGVPFCQSGTPNCDADYDYSQRPVARKAMAKVKLTGDIKRPMLTLHGTLDALLPIRTDSDLYRPMIRKQGRASLHRYYRVPDGTHVDSIYAEHPDRVRPILPCARKAFTRMVAWVERDRKPPRSSTLTRPREGYDILNRCRLR